MNTIPDQPNFLLPPDHPSIRKWQPWLQDFIYTQKEYVQLTLTPTEVRIGSVGAIQEMLLALQHFPNLIEKFIFSVDIQFQKTDHNPECYEGHQWKDEKAMGWYFKLAAAFPAVIYFIPDNDARFFTLMGDLILQRRIITYPDLSKGKAELKLSPSQMDLLAARLFNASCVMGLFCYGSGCDIGKYVNALIADYHVQFTYDQVKTAYMERIKK